MVKKKEEEKDPKKLENGSKIKDKPTEFYAYLAGLIDGDGSIKCTKNRGTPHLRGFSWDLSLVVASISKDFLMLLRSEIEEGSIQTYSRLKGRDLTIWTISHNGMRRLLPKIIPYLRLKRGRAVIALKILQLVSEHINTRHNDTEIEKLFCQLTILNRRGKIEKTFNG